MIYLACPYTHSDPEVRRRRFDAVNRLAGRLILAGEIVYSPISHSHAITETGLPVTWDFWEKQSLAMLSVCDTLVVYCIDGWEQSIGVRAEIDAAEKAGKPVVLYHPE